MCKIFSKLTIKTSERRRQCRQCCVTSFSCPQWTLPKLNAWNACGCLANKEKNGKSSSFDNTKALHKDFFPSK